MLNTRWLVLTVNVPPPVRAGSHIIKHRQNRGNVFSVSSVVLCLFSYIEMLFMRLCAAEVCICTECGYFILVPEPHRHLLRPCPQTCSSDVTTRTSVTQLSLPPSAVRAVIHTCCPLLTIQVRWHHCPPTPFLCAGDLSKADPQPPTCLSESHPRHRGDS